MERQGLQSYEPTSLRCGEGTGGCLGLVSESTMLGLMVPLAAHSFSLGDGAHLVGCRCLVHPRQTPGGGWKKKQAELSASPAGEAGERIHHSTQKGAFGDFSQLFHLPGALRPGAFWQREINHKLLPRQLGPS